MNLHRSLYSAVFDLIRGEFPLTRSDSATSVAVASPVPSAVATRSPADLQRQVEVLHLLLAESAAVLRAHRANQKPQATTFAPWIYFYWPMSFKAFEKKYLRPLLRFFK
jgi:hypothetical protein